MVHSSEISYLSHSFVEITVSNQRCISRNWRRFVFLIGHSTKTFLNVYTGITKRDLSACLHILSFSSCKVLFLTSFSREYCEQLEMNFGKLREVYLGKIPIYKKKIFQFLHIYYEWRYTSVLLDPKFAEFLGQNAQRNDAVSDQDASSSTKSYYHKSIKIVPNRFISFECPLLM